MNRKKIKFGASFDKTNGIALAGYVLAVLLAYGFAGAGEYLFSGLVLILAAISEYLFYYKKSGFILQAEAVFSLFWIGGCGLSAMKLSRLATEWTVTTWLCFSLVYLCFIGGYEGAAALERKRRGGSPVKNTGAPEVNLNKKTKKKPSDSPNRELQAKRILHCIYGILAVSVVCFLVEAMFCEVPLFSDKPHAYSYFHISGVHYFTVSSIFVLPLSVLYIYTKGRTEKRDYIRLGSCCLIGLMIPVLCVSRFQLMLAVLLSVCVAVSAWPGIRFRYVILAVAALVPIYVILTVARNHDVAYLNGIFEMKNSSTPIFITQPYMYVANNFDNFNCLVKELPSHAWGLRQLFPLFALTGLKFLKPELVSFPIYITKTELTTVTLIYDAYYDFGILGVALFGLLLGAVCFLVLREQGEKKNPLRFLFYAQLAMYLVFSFFTTWFSNPTTWFWFGLTGICYWYVGRKSHA